MIIHSFKSMNKQTNMSQTKITDSDGYLYCISNEYMPGILKVGYTCRTPEERL